MKFLDYFFLLRPMLIIPVWTISLLGARAAIWRTRGLSPFLVDGYPAAAFTNFDARMLWMLLAATLLSGGIFIINQIYDVESDRVNKKLFLLADGHISIKQAWVIYFVVSLLALAIAFPLNWQLGILFVVGALFGVQYSHPKFNYRQYPEKAARHNILGHGTLAFLFGWVMYANFDLEGLVKSLPFIFAVWAVYLNTTLPDVKGDKAAGKTTYAVVWGEPKTRNWALFLALLATVLSFIIADYALAISAALSAPFYIAAVVQKDSKWSVVATKISIITLSIFAALYFPIYAVIFIFAVVVTRIYYAKRFALAYPTLIDPHK